MRRPMFLAWAAAAVAVSFATLSLGEVAPVSAQRLAGKQAFAYGPDPLQTADYWPGRSAGAALVIFVHGGAWAAGDKRMMEGSDKLKHWRAQGYAVASLNYRLVPKVTVEQQAADVAAALAEFKRRAARLGFDPWRVALVGHSAGAHLVALVGTDPVYLRRAGLSFADIDGIVPLDGAAYDVSAQLESGPRMMSRLYRQAFGTDPIRQTKLSPTMHAGAPNAAEFLILHVQRDDGVRQSRALAAALERGGSHVQIEAFPGTGMRGHAEINRRMGDPNYPATRVLDAFLSRIFR